MRIFFNAVTLPEAKKKQNSYFIMSVGINAIVKVEYFVILLLQ